MKPKAKPYWLMAMISSGLLLANSACAQQHETHAAASAAQAAATAQRAAPQAAAKQWQWQTLATGLNHPWGLAFLPDGRFLVSERSGNLRVVDGQGQISAPVAGLPQIEAAGQGGLLDVVLDDDFARNRRLYFCFSEPGKEGSSTALAQGVLSADARQLTQVQTLFSQQPKVRSGRHFGCRIALTSSHIYLGMGDRGSRSEDAQNLANHIGKVVRLNRDGSVPANNPLAQQHRAQAAIWSYGHRNIQGMALDGHGRLWLSEHGAQGGDEINIVQAGHNYGWPVIAYGKDYGGGKIGAGITAKAGMTQPQYYWDPSIAPSGMTFVSGSLYGDDWAGNLLVGSLKFGYLARLVLDEQQVLREEKIEVGERVRDVRQAADGTIYIVTDSRNGKLLKLLP